MVKFNNFKRLVCSAFLSATLAFLAGCQTQDGAGVFQPVDLGSTSHSVGVPPAGLATNGVSSAVPAVSNPTGSAFNIGDLVIVNFSGLSVEALIPPHEERVKEDGKITLPLIGPVTAKGKTAGELQKLIRDKYIEGKYYPESLNVTVRGESLIFFVDGEVRSPNRYVWSEGMSVLKAISSAGGFTDFANKTEVTVTRQSGRTYTVNCKKALEKPELDLPVYPGDRVVVPRRWI